MESEIHALEIRSAVRQFGEIRAIDDVTTTVKKGEFFTLLGPSGSGKSTLLRIIAGLERLDDGQILLNKVDIAETPPWKRDIGMLFQSYALFPHMTVAKNIAYGMRRRGIGRAKAATHVEELLAMVGLEGFGGRFPARLSGGEKQRVALARAIAYRPSLLLLDEPLGALDEKVRREMRQWLTTIHKDTGVTFIYVTHDQEEAASMSDRVAVMQRGRVVQCDVPEVLFARPRSRFLAEFFRGFNLLEATLLAPGRDHADVSVANRRTRVQRSQIPLPPEGGKLYLGVRAENLRFAEGSDQFDVSFEGEVVDVAYLGVNTDHVVRLADGQHLTLTSLGREAVVGDRVVVGCRAEAVVPIAD